MNFRSKNSFGFSLIELMTTLVIVIVLSTVGFPMYRNYVISAKMAEAINIVDILDKNQQKYFAENGTFISAQPNPAFVPGIQSPGTSAAFGTSTEWAALGSPVTPGVAVLFSYQTFAGQTQPNSTTSIESSILYAPTANMDLERTGLYNASIQDVPMKSYALHAKDFELDFGFGNWNACADEGSDCRTACNGDKDCVASCNEKYGSPGATAAENCTTACVEAGKGQEECSQTCEEGDGTCDGGIGDQDCYQDTNESHVPENVEGSCVFECYWTNNGNAGSCMEQCGSASGADGSCQGSSDPDCSEASGEDLCNAFCPILAMGSCEGGCDESNSDGACDGGKADIDCYAGIEGEGGNGENKPAEDPPADDAEGDLGEEGGGGAGDSEGGDEGGSNACSSFGVSTPVDFGIQADVANHAWYITSSVANFIEGNDCTLVVKVVDIVNGQNSGGGLIQIRE